jgi:hypothetical protein
MSSEVKLLSMNVPERLLLKIALFDLNDIEGHTLFSEKCVAL